MVVKIILDAKNDMAYHNVGELMKKRPSKKNPHAVALGKKGGKARKVALSPARRSEIARQAVTTHWDRVRAAQVAAKPKRKRGGKAAA